MCTFWLPKKTKKGGTFYISFVKDHQTKSQDSVKYLGLFTDKYLNCEKIVNSVIGKVNATLKFLYRHCKYVDTKTRVTRSSYTMLLRLLIFFMVWWINKSLKQKLQVAQNKVIRFILNLQPMTRINYSVLTDVSMLKVEARVKQLRLNHVFTIFRELSPKYLNYNFVQINAFYDCSFKIQ